MADTNAPKFAANLKWLFPELPIEQQLNSAATEGFAGVELSGHYDHPAVHLRRLLADAGLQAVLINSPQGPQGSATAGGSACLPDHVDEFENSILWALEYATVLGCDLVHVVGGRRPEGLSWQRAMAQYVRNITWAAERARTAGIQLVLEMQNQRSAPGAVLESQAQAAAVTEAVGDSVGLLFDVFHTQVAEGDVVRTFEQFHPLVKHVQIGDVPARTEPGTGELAWPFVIERILSTGYTGWLGCEFRPLDGGVGVLDRLGEVFSHV